MKDTRSQQPRRSSLIFNLGKILITGIGLVVVLNRAGLDQVVAAMRSAEWGYLLAAAGLSTVAVFLRAFRWRELLLGLQAPVRTWRLTELYFVALFFNNFLPSGVGGDAVRVVEVLRDVPAAPAVGTVVVDRLLGIMGQLFLALVTLPFSAGLGLPAITLWSIGLICSSGLLASLILLDGRLLRRFSRWLPRPLRLEGNGKLAGIYAAVTGCGWLAVLRAFGISIAFNIVLIFYNSLLFRALHIDIALQYYFLFVPIMTLTLTLPISISGLGVRDNVAATLFLLAGVPQPASVGASLLDYFMAIVVGLPGAALYTVAAIRGLGSREAILQKSPPAPVRRRR